MTMTAARMRNGSLVSEERNSAALPVNVVAIVSGKPISRSRLLNRRDSLTERTAATQVKREGGGGKLSLVRNGQRRVAHAHRCKSAERHWLAGGRFDVNFVERIR